MMSGVQSDMQWIRRCKQEEIALIDSFADDDEVAERLKLMKMYGTKNSVPNVAGSRTSQAPKSIREEQKQPSNYGDQMSQKSRASKAPSKLPSKAPSEVSYRTNDMKS